MTPSGLDLPLTRAQAGDHLVLLHDHDRFLYDAVGTYLSAALHRGRHVLVIATPAHAVGIRAALEAHRALAGDARDGEPLTFLNAAETLSQILVDGWPDPSRFQSLMGAAIERADAAGDGPPCVFAEIVDLLFQAGMTGQAARLEDLWGGLARTRKFSLLCAYRIGLFDPRAARAVRQIACAHSHVIPLRDTARLEGALDQALAETLGEEGASLRSLLGTYPPALPSMPPAAAALLWLCESLPSVAERVVARTGELYREASEVIVPRPF